MQNQQEPLQQTPQNSQNQNQNQRKLVIQCQDCNLILYSQNHIVQLFYNLEFTEKLIQFSNLSNQLTQKEQTYIGDEDSYDYANVYQIIYCSRCNNEMGKYFISTSQPLQELINKYLIFLDRISIYDIEKDAYINPNEEDILIKDKQKEFQSSTKKAYQFLEPEVQLSPIKDQEQQQQDRNQFFNSKGEIIDLEQSYLDMKQYMYQFTDILQNFEDRILISEKAITNVNKKLIHCCTKIQSAQKSENKQCQSNQKPSYTQCKQKKQYNNNKNQDNDNDDLYE